MTAYPNPEPVARAAYRGWLSGNAAPAERERRPLGVDPGRFTLAQPSAFCDRCSRVTRKSALGDSGFVEKSRFCMQGLAIRCESPMMELANDLRRSVVRRGNGPVTWTGALRRYREAREIARGCWRQADHFPDLPALGRGVDGRLFAAAPAQRAA